MYCTNIKTSKNDDVSNRLFRPSDEQIFNFPSGTEAAIQMCSYKKVFWKYAANLHEKTHAEVLLYNFTNITLWHRCFPVNFLHVFRKSFLHNTSGGLLLHQEHLIHILQLKEMRTPGIAHSFVSPRKIATNSNTSFPSTWTFLFSLSRFHLDWKKTMLRHWRKKLL